MEIPPGWPCHRADCGRASGTSYPDLSGLGGRVRKLGDQIHKGVASPTSVVEMGQLSLVATSKNELLGEQDALAL